VQWDIALGGGRGRGGRGGRGRGGFGAFSVPAGSYMVTLTIGDRIVARKTATVEPDALH
jgi:hypothetical protein